jgi:hypothetical protein
LFFLVLLPLKGFKQGLEVILLFFTDTNDRTDIHVKYVKNAVCSPPSNHVKNATGRLGVRVSGVLKEKGGEEMHGCW